MPEFLNDPLVPLPPEPEAPSDPAVESLDDAALDALLPQGDNGELPPPVQEQSAPVEQVVELPPAPPAQESAPPVVEAPVQQEPLDPVAQAQADREATEQMRLDLQRALAALEMQKAHGSRLAGEIGHLRRQSTPSPDRADPAGADLGDGEIPQQVRERLERLERAAGSDAVDRAIAEAIRNVQPAPESAEIQAAFTKEELGKVVEKYAEDWQAALGSEDPRIAGQLARAVAVSVQADYRQMLWDRKRERAKASSVTQAEALRQRKLAAAPTPSGRAQRAAPAGPKTAEQMTNEELDRLLPP